MLTAKTYLIVKSSTTLILGPDIALIKPYFKMTIVGLEYIQGANYISISIDYSGKTNETINAQDYTFNKVSSKDLFFRTKL
jgi:hypothetical protein